MPFFAEIDGPEPRAVETLGIHLTEPKEVGTDIHLGCEVAMAANPCERLASAEVIASEADALDDVVRHLCLLRGNK